MREWVNGPFGIFEASLFVVGFVVGAVGVMCLTLSVILTRRQ